MKILFAASEAVPFCKTGGLADVVGSLSDVLAQKNHQVAIILPLYRTVRNGPFALKNTGKKISVPLGAENEIVEIWTHEFSKNRKAYFLRADRYFDRAGIYGDIPGVDFGDNDRRFILFSRGVLEAAKALKFKPDVIHTHDWQTGLISAYLKTIYSPDPFFAKTATLCTIHNMVYQGNFPRSSFDLTHIPVWEFRLDGLEFYGNMGMLKAALWYSDAINTVSPTYASEISTDSRFGCGLEGVLQSRIGRFRGITNGIDPDLWDPATDKLLAVPFSVDRVAPRAKCRTDLLRAVKLHDDGGPVAGFIGRLDPQKGVETLLDILPALVDDGLKAVLLGVGHARYVTALKELESRYPESIRVETGFAEPLAHKIYGGSDLFLMPSNYEPCGLGQLIAMRYGAVPVVTPTGGLRDTVIDASVPKKGTGFVSSGMSATSYADAVRAAMKWRESKTRWSALQKRAMSADHSWTTSATAYLNLYTSAKRWRLGKTD